LVTVASIAGFTVIVPQPRRMGDSIKIGSLALFAEATDAP